MRTKGWPGATTTEDCGDDDAGDCDEATTGSEDPVADELDVDEVAADEPGVAVIARPGRPQLRLKMMMTTTAKAKQTHRPTATASHLRRLRLASSGDQTFVSDSVSGSSSVPVVSCLLTAVFAC